MGPRVQLWKTGLPPPETQLSVGPPHFHRCHRATPPPTRPGETERPLLLWCAGTSRESRVVGVKGRCKGVGRVGDPGPSLGSPSFPLLWAPSPGLKLDRGPGTWTRVPGRDGWVPLSRPRLEDTRPDTRRSTDVPGHDSVVSARPGSRNGREWDIVPVPAYSCRTPRLDSGDGRGGVTTNPSFTTLRVFPHHPTSRVLRSDRSSLCLPVMDGVPVRPGTVCPFWTCSTTVETRRLGLSSGSAR